MSTYHLIRDFGYDPEDESESQLEVQQSPYCILHFVRFAHPLTASKERILKRNTLMDGNVSLDDSLDTITRTKPPLTLVNDVVSVGVSSNKSSYVDNMQAVLAGTRDFLHLIMPDDWVFAWIVNSEEAKNKVVQNLKAGWPANEFDSGLKFVGRVHGIREVLSQSPTGIRTIQTNLQATGFSELDSTVFFDPHLSRNEQYIERVFQHMGIPLKEVFDRSARDARGAGGIDINEIIPALIRAFIGEGIAGPSVSNDAMTMAHGAGVATKDAPFAYVIPKEVAQVLGVKRGSKPSGFSYADVLTTVLGRQKFRSRDDKDFSMFLPDGVKADATWDLSQSSGDVNRYTTDQPLMGNFLPMPTSLSRSVWSIISDYANPAVNEMYTALRPNINGRLVPTLVLRQMPFTSPVLASELGDEVTAFHELPRWRAHPSLLSSMDVGRSSAARTNFVHIYGATYTNGMGTNMASQLVRFPPMSDFQDIKRNGLRPFMTQVPASPLSIVEGGPQKWMTIRSDFLMGQHMMLNGVVSLTGIQAPIAPGDNFEYLDTLYHIESVEHTLFVAPDGTKSFRTRLSLTHGVRVSELELKRTKKTVNSRVMSSRVDMALKRGYADYVSSWAKTKGKRGAKMSKEEWLETESAKAYLEGNPETYEIDILQSGENPDLYLYTGTLESDDDNYNTGLTVEIEEEQ